MQNKLMILAASVLASCQTMSNEECAGADWRALGLADGRSGNDLFAAREESCAKKGFSADYDAYRAGADLGLYQYCARPRNGFERGLRGMAYVGSCPADLEDDFAAAYSDGRRAYQVNQALRSAEEEQRRLETRRREIDDAIRRQEAELRNATTDENRRRIGNELGRLNDERKRVNDDLRLALQQVHYRAQEVQRAHADIRDRWGPW